MSTTASTSLLPAGDRDDRPVQLLDDTWLLTIFAVVLAIALPWVVSAFAIDFRAASWGVLALGAIYVALTTAGGLSGVDGAWRTRLLAVLHAIGVIVIGFIWQQGGGLQNPAFLLAFALPVIGASFISRWQPYLTAALAILVVAAVALSQAPELRWYASGLSTAGEWLATLFGREGTAGSAPLPGFYAPFGYPVVLLEVFAVLLFACAVAAEYLGTVFETIRANVAVAQAEAERGQDLWATLLERLPVPAFLVEADTLRVICASERVAPAFCATHTALAGSNLLETVRFSYPDVVRELITGMGGVVQPSMLRVTDQLRAAEVRVQHIGHRGHRYALVIIEDMTETFCVKAALDKANQAALIVDPRGRVMGFNKPARGLFPGVEIGAEASRFLSLPGSGPVARWWEAGLTGRRKMHVEIVQRLYQVTSSAVPMPGEEESIHVIAFHPMARPEATTPSATTTTMVKPTLVQPQ